MILLVDNYDSFVHNLARYFERLGVETRVVRNDAMTAGDVTQLEPQAIVLSPGPGRPDEAGCSLELVREFCETVPLLGVCLGHQVIAQALGGQVVRGSRPWHGRASRLTHTGDGLFQGLPASLEVGRYHSLVVDAESLPECLEATAWTEDGVLMALAHRRRPLFGVQFHPESILTEQGYPMLANFLRLAGIETEVDGTDRMAQEKPPERAPARLPDRPVTF